MSALSMHAHPRLDRGHQPVPWRRMAWVTWRQHRAALAGGAALLGLAAIYLIVAGLQMHHAYAAVTGCHPSRSAACGRVADSFFGTYDFGAGITLALLQAVPALIGAFAGAPVLARELETGTFRFTWTQGIGRTRWAIAKLVALTVAVTAAAGAVSPLVSWYAGPLVNTPGYGQSRLYPLAFDLTGIALAAWTLAAFAIGVLAGVLIRRVVPAMFATLAAWSGLAFATGAYLRGHYITPLTTTRLNVSSPAWVMSQRWTRGGKPASLDMINQTLHAIDVQARTPEVFSPGPASPGNIDPLQYLLHHGYLQLTVYQPGSRYWPFQWIEGGWLLTLSLLLIAATVWLIRRSAA